MDVLLIFSSSTPILILSTFDDPDHPGIARKLSNMGIEKFIGFQVPLDKTKKTYGLRFEQISSAIRDADDIRVLDYNGFTAFRNYSVDELNLCYKHEPDED